MTFTFRAPWSQDRERYRNRLDPYGSSYFDQMIGDFRALPGLDESSPSFTFLSGLVKTPSNERSWNDLYNFEKTLLPLLPADRLRRRAFHIREEFRQAVTSARYVEYERSSPPSLLNAQASEILADSIELLDELHWIYTVRPEAISQANRLSLIVAGFTVFLVAISWAVFAHSRVLTTLPLVVIAGCLGGCISTVQRIQTISDGDSGASALLLAYKTWPSIFLSPLNGGIFAVVMYIVFAADLVQGSAFPRVVSTSFKSSESQLAGPCCGDTDGLTETVAEKPPAVDEPMSGLGVEFPDPQPTASSKNSPKESIRGDTQQSPVRPGGIRAVEFLWCTGPATGLDFAKLLIWAFLAGFAERFVPDTLDSLRAKTNAKGESGKAETGSKP